MAKESELNPFQAARAESLQVAGNVLSNSKTLFGGKTPPTVVESITDLLTVAEWVYGDPIQDMNSLDRLTEVANPLKALLASGAQMVEITPDKLPTLFEALARMYPDCGNPDCEVHGPAAAAKDLNPIDFGNMEQTGMAEASDFEGGESDADRMYPPFISPLEYFTGTVMNGKDGRSWVVRAVRAEDTEEEVGKVWELVTTDAVSAEENREQDANEED